MTIHFANYSLSQPIRASGWKTLIRHTHYVFSRSGVRVNGIVFHPNPWTSANTAYTTTDDGGFRDLDTWWPQILLPRRISNAGVASVAVTCRVYGHDVGVRFALRAADTNAEFTPHETITIESTSKQYASATKYLTWAQSHQGSSTANDLRLISVAVDAKHIGSGDAARIYGIELHSKITLVSEIPTEE